MSRITTFPLCLPEDLKVCNGHESPCARYRWVTGLVPLCVILSAQDMKKVPFMECKLLPIPIRWLVVVQRFDDLLRRYDSSGRFGRDGNIRGTVALSLFVTLQRSSNGLVDSASAYNRRRASQINPYLHA